MDAVFPTNGGGEEVPKYTSYETAPLAAFQPNIAVCGTPVAPKAGDTNTGAAGADPLMTVKSSPNATATAPPPLASTWFVNWTGTGAATVTDTEIAGKLAPAASPSLREQLFAVQLQPSPDMSDSVSPAGRVSVTVNDPLAGPANAELLTIRE